MKKSFAIYLAVLLLFVFVFASCSRGNSGPTIKVTDPTMTTSTTTAAATIQNSTQTVESTTEELFSTVETLTETTTEIITEPDLSIPEETQSAADDEPVMLISVDPANPFLNAVVQKYGINPELLLAFYESTMQTEGNLVFEFDGTRDSSGKVLRTKQTLKNIYTVDQYLVAKKATGSAADGNEYTKKESLYCEYFVKWVVFKVYGNDIKNA